MLENNITHYRGWVMKPKKNGKFELAYRDFSNFPVEADSINQAKKNVDWIENGEVYVEVGK